MDFVQVLNGGLHLDLEVPQWSKFEVHNIRPNTTPKQMFATCGQLQLLPGNSSRRNRGVILMVCVRVLGAPDGSRRQRKTKQELFSCTRRCEHVAKKLA